MDDWYNITTPSLAKHGASALLSTKYSNSPSALVMGVYSSHNWEPWRFATIPRAKLCHPSLLRAFFDTQGRKLNVKSLQDWRNISFRQIAALGPCWHVKKMGLFQALKNAYPEHQWNSEANGDGFVWAANPRITQNFIVRLLQQYVLLESL